MDKVSIRYRDFNHVVIIKNVTEQLTEEGMMKITYIDDRGVYCRRWIRLDDISEVIIIPIEK